MITVFIAKRFGWKVGDKVPMISNVTTSDGSHTWTFDIVGIIDDVDRPGQGAHTSSAITTISTRGGSRTKAPSTASWCASRIPASATQIGREIDHCSPIPPPPPARYRKNPSARPACNSLGDVSFFTRAVISAVLFMLLFLTGNTMMQSVRERIPEFAVLKTLGFSDSGVLALVLAEAVMLCLAAGLAGLAIVKTGRA